MYRHGMTLHDWVASFPRDERPAARAALGRHLGCSEIYIRSMANGNRQIPAELVLSIERYTKGVVSRHDMRPDIYPNESRATGS